MLIRDLDGRESEYKNEDVAESIKEEKKRKQMEAIAEDLFNSEKVCNHTCIIVANIAATLSLKPVLLLLYHREDDVVQLVPCMGCLLVNKYGKFLHRAEEL